MTNAYTKLGLEFSGFGFLRPGLIGFIYMGLGKMQAVNLSSDLRNSQFIPVLKL